MIRKIVTGLFVLVLLSGVALAADTLQDATRLAKAGKYDESIAILNKLVKSEDGNPNFLYNRAVVYELKKDQKPAMADYEQIIKLYPTSKVAYLSHGKLARIYKLNGDAVSAKKHIYAAVKLSNQNALEDPGQGSESAIKKKVEDIYRDIK